MLNGEKVRIERCPKCSSTHLENIFYLKRGEPARIYIRCCKCNSFVARYTLIRYTSDKSYESLLRSMKGPFASGRRLTRELEAFSNEISNGFEYVTNLLEKGSEEVEVHIEDLIAKNDKQSLDD